MTLGRHIATRFTAAHLRWGFAVSQPPSSAAEWLVVPGLSAAVQYCRMSIGFEARVHRQRADTEDVIVLIGGTLSEAGQARRALAQSHQVVLLDQSAMRVERPSSLRIGVAVASAGIAVLSGTLDDLSRVALVADNSRYLVEAEFQGGEWRGAIEPT